MEEWFWPSLIFSLATVGWLRSMAGRIAEGTGRRVSPLQLAILAWPMILVVAVFSLATRDIVKLPSAPIWVPCLVLFNFLPVPFIFRRPDLPWSKLGGVIVGAWGYYFLWSMGFSIYFHMAFGD